ncbi:hypothetical protein HYE82_28310 [Streptomyces sp. BR123]|uniref:hypothetical protein n=1 Tax=Streptomyces sp. BR123 TaxID=2749828 RepID=UPI0015C478D8|nr:hypothetical protein [Streptomyces sp. BR123]NXY98205.1 hypothetical protein [Streptomyces sp. BR123]
MSDVNNTLDAVQIAAHGMAMDLADVLVRGHLKEHPSLIAFRLGVVTGAVDQVRTAVKAELASGRWPRLAADPAAEHERDRAAFAGHHCDCPYCPHAL